MNLEDLKGKANDIRVDIVEMVAEAGSGHPGGSLSSVEILCALYFGGVLDHDANDPKKEDRDRFLLSKGHAAPVLYATLAESGYFPKEELKTLRKLHSRRQGHPDCRRHGVRPEARRQRGNRLHADGRRRMPGRPGLGGRYVRIPPQPGQPGRDSRS